MAEEIVDQLKPLREKCAEEHCEKYQVRLPTIHFLTNKIRADEADDVQRPRQLEEENDGDVPGGDDRLHALRRSLCECIGLDIQLRLITGDAQTVQTTQMIAEQRQSARRKCRIISVRRDHHHDMVMCSRWLE